MLTQRVLVLLEAAKLEKVRVLSTEQYPKGLGHTIPVLAEKLAQVKAKRIEKLAFSAVDAPEFALALDAPRPTTIVVVGMETHVCVYQTVRDLVNRGLEVHVPVDAVISRRDEDREAGLSLCERAGACSRRWRRSSSIGWAVQVPTSFARFRSCFGEVVASARAGRSAVPS